MLQFDVFAEALDGAVGRIKNDIDQAMMRNVIQRNANRAKFIVNSKETRACVDFARDLRDHGLLRLPHRSCFFQTVADTGNPAVLFADEHVTAHGAALLLVGAARVADEIRILPPALWDISPTSPTFRQFQISKAASEFEVEAARGCGFELAGILGFINSRSVKERRVDADERVNERRVRRGKKPIHSYTIIDIDTELMRRAQSGEGSHASPRAHWRRGHVRRLSSERLAVVRPCIVNGKDEPAPGPNTYRIGGR